MVKIYFGDEYIELSLKGEWVPSDAFLRPLASIANVLSRPPFYEYSPSHGGYGPLLANQIAKRLGGKVSIPVSKEEKPPKDIVF